MELTMESVDGGVDSAVDAEALFAASDRAWRDAATSSSSREAAAPTRLSYSTYSHYSQPNSYQLPLPTLLPRLLNRDQLMTHKHMAILSFTHV